MMFENLTLFIKKQQSSLTLALLRCIITEGTVYYDGIPTKSINLEALRSHITIIPQTVRKLLLVLLGCRLIDLCSLNSLVVSFTTALISFDAHQKYIGTLRQNLDPFEQHDDATLNDALRSAGLFSLQEEAGEAGLNLDSKIAGGGGNLSVGQRQIIALVRAMVRGSKLLILDEGQLTIQIHSNASLNFTRFYE